MEQTISESERKDVFDALVTLKKALELGIVSADDILNLVSRKLNSATSGPDQIDSRRNRDKGLMPTSITITVTITSTTGMKVTDPNRKCGSNALIVMDSVNGRVITPAKYVVGLGSLLIPTSYVECGRCYGLGSWKSDEPCSACKGIGHVPVRRY